MRVVHLTASSSGGAGVAARRSVDALCQDGVDAELWTDDGENAKRGLRTQRWSRWRARLDLIPLRCYPRRRLYSSWSNSWQRSRIAPVVAQSGPDLVHLHWVGAGFLHLSELAKFRAPVVWTLHDAWAFTGGCHYPADCARFRSGCGCCPQLGSSALNDLSARNVRSKRRPAASVARWITPSAWLGEFAATSGLIPRARLRVIVNGFPEDVFTPTQGDTMRAKLALPAGTVVMVAGAADLQDMRKGAALLPEVVARVQKTIGRRCVLLVFGGNADALPRAVGVDVRSVGALRTEKEVAAVLAAADLMLLPSLQDNLPNVAVEAQACGCPVIGFDTGGLQEIIEQGVTGAVTAEISVSGLTSATVDWLARHTLRTDVTARCRTRFEERFASGPHARQLKALYDEVLAETSHR